MDMSSAEGDGRATGSRGGGAPAGRCSIWDLPIGFADVASAASTAAVVTRGDSAAVSPVLLGSISTDVSDAMYAALWQVELPWLRGLLSTSSVSVRTIWVWRSWILRKSSATVVTVVPYSVSNMSSCLSVIVLLQEPCV
jgi:hypothetical protein